uniref:Aminotransferase class I/classII large domain-containing protein n=1 Tax=Castor canadensis TaxID=51338 RepID=A0A8C0XEW2_CASCN
DSHRQSAATQSMGDRDLRNRKIFSELLEMMLEVNRTMEDHFLEFTTREMQGPPLNEESYAQTIREQQGRIRDLMSKIVKLLWSEVVDNLGLKQPPSAQDSSIDITGRPTALSFRQPDQPDLRQREFEVAFVSYFLSKRGSDISTSYHKNFQNYEDYQRDKYHEETNPLGFLNLSTSENKLCLDLMTERVSHAPGMLGLVPLRPSPPDILREEVARFLSYYCKAPYYIDPENVVVLNGCCSVFSALAMVLCDPGEAFLVPTPFCGGFVFTSSLYAKVELIFVYLESEVTAENTHPFQLTVEKLELVLMEAKSKAKKVRGLLLSNPQNPLGDVYSLESLMQYLIFAKRHKLHVIMDEVYMLSVFDESIKFHSVLSIESLPDPQRTHMIWGTSKDFGIAGFRFGALYTYNKEVASAVSSFGYLHSISGIAQYKLCRLLQDREWINRMYLPVNHCRLRFAHKYVTDQLEALKIPFLNRGSGLYIWINLKEYLEPCTFEEEKALHQRFLAHKLMLSRGKSFTCKEPGWFRLIFAENHQQLREGMHRFCQALQDQKDYWVTKELESAMRE